MGNWREWFYPQGKSKVKFDVEIEVAFSPVFDPRSKEMLARAGVQTMPRNGGDYLYTIKITRSDTGAAWCGAGREETSVYARRRAELRAKHWVKTEKEKAADSLVIKKTY